MVFLCSKLITRVNFCGRFIIVFLEFQSKIRTSCMFAGRLMYDISHKLDMGDHLMLSLIQGVRGNIDFSVETVNLFATALA